MQLCKRSLADRRVRANLLFLRRLIDGSIDVPSLLSQVNFKIPSRSTTSQVHFIVPTRDINYGNNQFNERMMRLGNVNPIYFSRF